jgi:prepilin-type N-terminal cleavage/methylation domain-containing protein
MHTMVHRPAIPLYTRGFSLMELLLVAAVGAVVFTAGALAFRVIAKNQRNAVAFQEVTLPTSIAENFFPGST